MGILLGNLRYEIFFHFRFSFLKLSWVSINVIVRHWVDGDAVNRLKCPGEKNEVSAYMWVLLNTEKASLGQITQLAIFH